MNSFHTRNYPESRIVKGWAYSEKLHPNRSETEPQIWAQTNVFTKTFDFVNTHTVHLYTCLRIPYPLPSFAV